MKGGKSLISFTKSVFLPHPLQILIYDSANGSAAVQGREQRQKSFRPHCSISKKAYNESMKSEQNRHLTQLVLIFIALIFPIWALAETCRPTEPDMLGPFYKPNAPVRSSVGEGYLLQGTVRAAPKCTTVENARIEFWLTGPDGRYDDAYRATLFSDAEGRYRFTSNFPQPYFGRPPHIHIRVSAAKCKTLVTQHYPQPGAESDSFDLVLRPAD